MKHVRSFILGFCFLTLLFPLVVICPPDISASSTIRPPPEEHRLPFHQLTPAQQYSGELLAYLLKVVLGRAGEPASRRDWQVRAMDEDLDFDHMVKVMTDPAQNQLDFMVLDSNILDLSQVLYHYDKTLSLYKGDYGITSIYPAPEILAIRLFLLKKIHSREKIHLDAFMRREGDLLNPDYQPSPEDLAATLLSSREMKFLRDIFLNEPDFYRYLTCPFLLKEIAETGVLASGNLVKEIIQSADYTPYRINSNGHPEKEGAVNIAILPSMTQEFQYGWPHGSLSEHGFKPTDFFRDVSNKLKKEILEETRKRLKQEISKTPYPKLTQSQWREAWGHLAEQYIAFYVEDKRPLVIYPENASQVIREVCPKADFTVILLGKNIYRAIYFDPAKDVYPSVNRLYIDIMDIEYDQAGEEIEQISQFICSRLRDRFTALIDRDK